MREEFRFMATRPTSPGEAHSGDGSRPERRGHIGRIVAGSLATGLIAALLLVAAPFISPQENDVTGALLCGFAVGWAMLAILSTRYTDQPQRWAVAPDRIRRLLAGGAELGVATHLAGTGDLDVHTGASTAS
jgi:hypothetical protein